MFNDIFSEPHIERTLVIYPSKKFWWSHGRTLAHPLICPHQRVTSSLRASSPIWASEVSTLSRGLPLRGFARPSRRACSQASKQCEISHVLACVRACNLVLHVHAVDNKLTAVKTGYLLTTFKTYLSSPSA